jgi:hypothetical protein
LGRRFGEFLVGEVREFSMEVEGEERWSEFP